MESLTIYYRPIVCLRVYCSVSTCLSLSYPVFFQLLLQFIVVRGDILYKLILFFFFWQLIIFFSNLFNLGKSLKYNITCSKETFTRYPAISSTSRSFYSLLMSRKAKLSIFTLKLCILWLIFKLFLSAYMHKK